MVSSSSSATNTLINLMALPISKLTSHLLSILSTIAANKKEWDRVDALVKMWIFGTITQNLTQSVHKKNQNAYDLWDSLENLFHDNKDAREMQLDQELWNITQGDSTINAYCTQIKNLVDLLENIEVVVPEKNLVNYTINGLNPRFDHIASPPPYPVSYIIGNTIHLGS
ncbi:uncharacterized protein LOC111898260 [Lactuca sativa]|uniref:uncharacterized protein LOC111898260 n=1 Tax=Lactuca sativa TaxID=4236 RepID=UPI000CD850E6|nr:uncharacterized protein LOC111898260 [Lactuca sativa]